jgi:hypothetical protein
MRLDMKTIPIATNELKKGALVVLNNGWRARLMDNQKGNVRMAEVYGAEHGYFDEIGSVYCHNIHFAIVNNKAIPVQHTNAQKTLKQIDNKLHYKF